MTIEQVDLLIKKLQEWIKSKCMFPFTVEVKGVKYEYVREGTFLRLKVNEKYVESLYLEGRIMVLEDAEVICAKVKEVQDEMDARIEKAIAKVEAILSSPKAYDHLMREI